MIDHKNIFNYSAPFLSPDRMAHSTWTEHVPFAMFLVELLKPKKIVELGTNYGVSYCAFCQAVKHLQLETKCYAVDTWEGDPHTGFYGDDVLKDLQAHHNPRYSTFSTLLQTTFDEAVQQFKDKSIDLLHIDGFHTYEAVKHDFENWLPKMSDQGVVLFHDTNIKQNNFGVWKLGEELREKYTYFEFFHGCGLGIAVIGDTPPTDLLDFLNTTEVRQENIRAAFHRLGIAVDLTYKLSHAEDVLANTEIVLNETRATLALVSAELEKICDISTQKDEELHNIKNSTAWRLNKYLMPPESTREKIGVFVVKTIKSLKHYKEN